MDLIFDNNSFLCANNSITVSTQDLSAWVHMHISGYKYEITLAPLVVNGVLPGTT